MTIVVFIDESMTHDGDTVRHQYRKPVLLMTPALEATPLTRSVVVGGEQALSFFIFV